MLVFKLKSEVDPEAKVLLFEKLRELPSMFPAMKQFELGENMNERDHTYSYGLTATFATREELVAYLTSAEHEGMVRQYFAPLVDKRAIVSFFVS